MTDKIKWYMDTRKWRRDRELTPELMEDYDRMWCDRVIICGCVFFMIAIKIGMRIGM